MTLNVRQDLTTALSSFQRSVRHALRAVLLPLFAATLVVSMWTAVYYQIGVEREAAHNEGVAHAQSLAHTLAEHVSHILRQTDHATQLFKLKYEETHGKLRLAQFTRRSGLMESVLPARLDLPIALVDQHGQVIDTMHGFVPHSVAAERWFQALESTESDTANFTTPMTEPKTKKWLIQVARRLNDANGNFAGAVVILIDPVYFVDDYDRLSIDDTGMLVLAGRESGLSIGRVGERVVISNSLDFTPTLDPSRPSDELRVSKPIDSVRRIYSYRDMPRYSLMAVIGVTEPVAMAKFVHHQTIYMWVLIGATTLIVAISALLMEQSKRLGNSMRAAQEAQSILRAAADGSLDAFMILKAIYGRAKRVDDFLITDLNERCAEMIGAPRSGLLRSRTSLSLPDCRSSGLFARYVRVMESGKALEEEFEMAFTNQPKRWLHHQVVPVDGGVAITTRDITERKHAEREILDNRSFLQSLIEHTPLLIYVKCVRPDSFGRMLVWNAAAEKVTGYKASDVVGRTDTEAFTEEFLVREAEDDRKMLTSLEVVEQEEEPFTRPDGSVCYLHSMSVPLLGADGGPAYILCIAEDITIKREQALALRANQAELAAMTNASPLGLVRASPDGMCTYVNPTFETITGLTRKQALGRGWVRAVHPEDRPALRIAFEHLRQSQEPYKGTVRCLHFDGRIVWTALKIAPIRIDGHTEGFVGTVDDVTTLREAELALRESEARLRTIADTLPTMVAYIDADQTYRFHNSAYEREFGWQGINVLGRTVRATVGEARYARLQPYIEQVLHGQNVIFEEDDVRDGHERSLEVMYIPQMCADNINVIGFHVMRQDVTAQKREKKRLIKLAQVDALTGLTNRAGFMQKLSDAMSECAAMGNVMAVMYMDIDRFKPVNDTYGHNVGDELLKAFSQRLTHTMRASDTIARLGGDEFTIIMEKLHRPEDAKSIAAKIVSVMQTPFELGDVTVNVSASIGLAYYHNEDMSPEALLKQADVFLYQAKQAGRNTYRTAA